MFTPTPPRPFHQGDRPDTHPVESGFTRRAALALLGAGALAPLAACGSPGADAQPPGAAGTSPGTDRSNEPLHFLSVAAVASRLQQRTLRSTELTRHMLDRIAALDPTLKSYATVMADQALADAGQADREIEGGQYKGPLHGVPVAVKDLCFTKGVRTMGGTILRTDFVPESDATVVTRLREAGAVVLGKLNLTEGAMLTYHPSLGIPLNPWNQARWPGGSSSGSGVATAAGLCFAAIGTDTGGSIRFPSSACGVVGLKPTYGRVSRVGVLALSESLDHVGAMGRTVADVAAMYDAIAGYDRNDPASLRAPAGKATPELSMGVKGLRVGIDRAWAFDRVNPVVVEAVEQALSVLRSLGAEVVDIRMPDMTAATQLWLTICSSDAYEAFKPFYASRATDFGPYLRSFLESGSRIEERQYLEASARRAAFTLKMNELLMSVDAMICPSGGDPAWPVTPELQVADQAAFTRAWSAAAPRATAFTLPMNLAGTPTLSVPAGFTADGLPLSLQLVGRSMGETTLCRIGAAYEQATSWHTRHPAV